MTGTVHKEPKVHSLSIGLALIRGFFFFFLIGSRIKTVHLVEIERTKGTLLNTFV